MGRPADPAGAGTLTTAGERLEPAAANTWGAGRRMFNAYGPTETTVCASVAAVAPAAGGSPPIGGPLVNTRLYIVDAGLGLVPPGVTGDLYAAGAQVARGYGGRPALTAERFVADPFAGDGGRMYKTGDRARWRADGQVEFLGRADDQLKVHGVRIEPAEIEAALTAHPAVRAAVVTAWGEGADRRLVAYLVPDNPADGIPPAGELRAALSRRLPDAMVPATFVELASLPLTPNGKIDRHALPAPDSAAPAAGDAYVAPATPTEEMLAGIWAQVLGLERVGVVDDFFELGGHSLLATQVSSRIAEVLGVVVPLAALFDHPTVRGLAGVLEDGTRVTVPPVTAVGRDRPLPLSFGQQRMWFLDRLEPGSTDFNVPMHIRWRGHLDTGALERALDTLVLRHEVLRTRLMTGVDGTAVQVVDPPGRLVLPLVDVSGAPDPETAGRDLVALDAVAPFDLAEGPLMRAVLIRQAADEHVLALTLHHVVSDEWSAAILRRELTALYGGAALPPLPVQYADFAVWQREWLAGEVLDGQLSYWRERLAGLPVLELPTDRPRPAVRSSAGAVVGFEIPVSTVEGLRALSRDSGATMFMTLLAGWSLLLSRYCGTDDVVVGTPVAGRNRAEIEGLIGFFVNTLVMRTDLSGDPAFGELLSRVRRTALDAYAHQDLPFEQLVDALVTKRDRSRSPLFQVLFNYFTDEDDHGPGEGDAPGDGSDVVTQFDLRLVLVDDGTRLTGGIEYSTALFDASTVRRVADHLATLLGAVAADASLPASRVPLLAEPERDRIVREWNDTAAETVPASAHETVVAWADQYPDAVAVVSGQRVLTYAGLVSRAAGLARQLRRLGVGPETVVGLCVERGVDMPVAVLAVWLAGGAYVPLDAAYPPERRARMLPAGGASGVWAPRAAPADLPAGRLPVVVLEDHAAPAPPPATAPATEPGQTAYVIYTSGSTGTPKGVHVTHGGLANLIEAQRHVFGPETGDRAAILQFAPHGFDASVWELVLALANGGPLVVATAAERAEPAALARAVRGHGVRLATLPPSLLDVLEPGDLCGLSTLVAAGERLEPHLAERWHCQYRLVNAYGPTETTVCATAATVAAGGAPPIGAPLLNTRVFVLDEHLNPVPAGVAGELYVAGDQVARGYGGRPALTAERFVADPFAGDGGRMYRTGDRARWRADGQVEFLGRADDQLKVRGIRIEAGEIEAALVAHPGVRTATVTAWGEIADRRLVAYLVPDDPADGVPDAAELRDHLRRRLPDFMVPTSYVELAALPVNRNGKIDRAALPAPGEAPVDLAAFVAPATPTEQILAQIWAEILGREPIGARDDFFELGGHSLLATRLMSRIREVFAAEVALTDFFDHPTVAETAAAINRAKYGIEGDYEEFEL
ncbi:amino acid adenylation domain-containing protein [Micromonospora sp. CPCC 205371]|nr:amino acid adenylation domain-containing protein [Micromonospora sp. CPCC 205371]